MIYIVKGGKEMEVEIDINRLHADLIEHFGSMTVLAHRYVPNSVRDLANEMSVDLSNVHMTSISHGILSGGLGMIDTMYETGNYQGLVDLAQAEGFDLTNYMVT